VTIFKRSLAPAIILLLIVTILLCLPGSAIPHGGWLGEIPADKIVHILLFASLFLLWYWPLSRRKLKYVAVSILLIGISYGIAMEFIQDEFIPNRDFEIADMIADATGLVAGWLVSKKWA